MNDTDKCFVDLEMILLKPGMEVVLALADVMDSTDSSDEVEQVIQLLLHFYGEHCRDITFIKHLLAREVEFTMDPSTLFRRNSFATKTLTLYTKRVGKSYLRDTLSAPLQRLQQFKGGFELDPNKVTEGDNHVQNIENVRRITDDFLSAILDSAEQCPSAMRQLCIHLDSEVGKKFSENRKSAVGGYIFLRFFCPAIVAPESAGLLPEGERLSREARRVGILVSKVIQNLANGILSFSKEGYMSVLDDFLASAAARLDRFLELLLACPSGGTQEAKPRRKPLQAATLLAIAQHLKAHIHNIGQYLALDPESRNSVRSFRSAEKRGFLKKRGEGFRNWRKRWFILKDNFLYYFRNEMDPSITGAIPLENYALVPTSSTDGFEFEIRTPQRTYEIKAATEAERTAWLDAMRISQQRAESQELGSPLSADSLFSDITSGSGNDDTSGLEASTSTSPPSTNLLERITLAKCGSEELSAANARRRHRRPRVGSEKLDSPAAGGVSSPLSGQKWTWRGASSSALDPDAPPATTGALTTNTGTHSASSTVFSTEPSTPSMNSPSLNERGRGGRVRGEAAAPVPTARRPPAALDPSGSSLTETQPSSSSAAPRRQFFGASRRAAAARSARGNFLGASRSSEPSEPESAVDQSSSSTATTAASQTEPASPSESLSPASPSEPLSPAYPSSPGAELPMTPDRAPHDDEVRESSSWSSATIGCSEQPSSFSPQPASESELGLSPPASQLSIALSALPPPPALPLGVDENTSAAATTASPSISVSSSLSPPSSESRQKNTIRAVERKPSMSHMDPIDTSPLTLSTGSSAVRKEGYLLSSPRAVPIDVDMRGNLYAIANGLAPDFMDAYWCRVTDSSFDLSASRTTDTSTIVSRFSMAAVKLVFSPQDPLLFGAEELGTCMWVFRATTPEVMNEWITAMKDAQVRAVAEKKAQAESLQLLRWHEITSTYQLILVDVVFETDSLWLFVDDEIDSTVPYENATFRTLTETDGEAFAALSTTAESCFCIMRPDTPLLIFCAAQKEDSGRWLADLKQRKLDWWKSTRAQAEASATSSQAAVDPEVAVYRPVGRFGACGYLRVYDERRCTWLRTFFVLEDHELLSFKSMYSTQIRARFQVHECAFHTKVIKGVDLSFQLQSSTSQSLTLEACSDAELRRWLLALKKAKNFYWAQKSKQAGKEIAKSPRSVSENSGPLVVSPSERERTPSLTVQTLEPEGKRGFLMKVGKNNHNWRRRWFVLSENFLLYFESSKDSTPLGEVAVQDAFAREADPVQSADMEEQELGFAIVTTHRTYHLLASSAEDRLAWLGAIKRAKANYWRSHKKRVASTKDLKKHLRQLTEARARKPEREGWLSKQGGRVKNWKKRWFILRNTTLYYFTSAQANDQAGSIPLHACSVSRSQGTSSGRKKYEFQIVTRHRVYFLRSESEEDTNKWIASISAAIDASRSAVDEGSQTASQQKIIAMPTKVQLSDREIQKAGWLHKQGGKVKSWKKRWCVVSNTLLYYFRHPDDQEAAGSIPLDASSVVFAEDRTKKKYCFEVSTRFRNFFLYAENELEMASWMDVIKTASNNQDNAKGARTANDTFHELTRVLQDMQQSDLWKGFENEEVLRGVNAH
mmetsp:Transcript_6443/g.19522  ORF Transcript_6443/g.19522 Transcript_6443/m.19522 type:complete len:1618 (-) Transcript_6443:166-5019(-)